MRVNELSKQIGKSNKEVLEILQKNHFDVKSHSSKVTEEQAEAVRCFLAGAKRQMTASKTDTGKAETNRVEDIKKEPLEAEKKEAEKTTEPPKKRIAAVYRPQNSVQRGSRPAGKANTGNAAKTGAPAGRPAAASAEQTAEPAKSAAPAENRDGQRSGYQGNRDGQRSGGYQGNRDGQRSGGYQGNR
ncbi:translation initiation factor IF-2 N-terminal domain-containing protein, partial [Clostridium sp. AF02-29]